MSEGRTGTPPPDLEIRVRTAPVSGRTQLLYTLHSPGSVVPFTYKEITGPTFAGDPEALHRLFLQQIERLGSGFDAVGEPVLHSEIERKLEGIGRWLSQQLFNEEMTQAYRRFRTADTLQVISDEPWIPWEMVKPYDDKGEVIDDEFFAERFAMTRWLAGAPPAGEITIQKLVCVAERDLPLAQRECDSVRGLSRPGLADAGPVSSVKKLLTLLAGGGIDLLHLSGHGTFDPDQPNEAAFRLPDGSVFHPSDLHGPVQTQIGRDRPLVVLNACSSGRQGLSWTGLGGWADRWVRGCGCGAFIGPHWPVRDSVAFAFAKELYASLERGECLGQAGRAARRVAKEAHPGNPSWLAYAIYGHPNARFFLGQTARSADSAESQAPQPSVTSFLPSLRSEPLETTTSGARPALSKNLRIRQRFTDRDRDRFVEESFNEIADFFESSLSELQARNPLVEIAFRRVDRNRFNAAIYVDGKKESSCRIWMASGDLGDIVYAVGDSGPDNSYNETLSVVDDGYSMLLRPLGLRFFGQSDRSALTRLEAAEYLWEMLISPLQ